MPKPHPSSATSSSSSSPVLLIGVLIWSLFTPKVYIVKGFGVVEGGNKNTIMSAYSGEILDVKVQNGDYAQEGDLLFSLKCTDLDIEKIQVDGKIAIYEKQISQLQKLEKSIKDSTNYFDPNNEDDKPYYNQYRAYKSAFVTNGRVTNVPLYLARTTQKLLWEKLR